MEWQTGPTSITGSRAYWIQGRQGTHWSNVETLVDVQSAIDRLGRLVASDRYDELRLVEARISATSGKAVYTELLVVRDGEVIDPVRADPVGPVPLAAEAAHPELPLWTDSADGQTGQEAQPGLFGEADPSQPDPEELDWYAAPRRPAPARMVDQPESALPGKKGEGVDQPALDPSDDPPDTKEPLALSDVLRAEPFVMPEAQSDPRQSVPRLSVEPRPGPLLGRPAGEEEWTGLDAVEALQALEDREADAGNMIARGRDRRRRGLGRGTVLAGLFILAVAGGVGLSAVDPQTSARLSATLMGELPVFAPGARLAAAVEANDAEAVRDALADGAMPDARFAGGVPALLVAARQGADQAVFALLESGADAGLTVEPGRPIVHVMAAEGLVAGLAASLDAGVAVDLPGGTAGCVTPLMSAATQGRAEAARVLIARGARLGPLPGCELGPLDAARLHPEVEELLRTEADTRGAASAMAEPTPAPILAPFTIPERQAMLREPERLGDFMAQAIDRGDLETLRYLMANRPSELPLDALGLFAQDSWGTGYRLPVDYAVLHGRLDAARMLLGAGAVPSARLIHLAVDARSHPALAGAAEVLLGNGADPNAVHDGLTPLMRAALKGDWDGVQLLLAYGADAGLTTPGGVSAAEFASRRGDTEMQEMLTLRAQEQVYAPVMLGLSWFDTLSTLAPPTEACGARNAGYLVCALDRPVWLDDAIRVEGHFDLEAAGRLVAIELHGAPLQGEQAALQRFDTVAAEVQSRLPAGHEAFAVETAPRDANLPFLQAIRPEVAQAAWSRYWSDEDKARPVFLQLSLVGVDQGNAAQWRLVVGNPFRTR